MSTQENTTPSARPVVEGWQTPARLGWSMQNIAAFLPVRTIARGARVTTFGVDVHDVSSVPVTHPWGGAPRSFGTVMSDTCTDAWLVTRDGVAVAASYTPPMTERSLHLLMSVSKSLTCATAGVLAGAGLLDVEQPVTRYVPALSSSGYVGARVRDLLDMRTGIRFSEDYLDDGAEVRLLEEAIDWAPRRHLGVASTLLGFLASLQAERPHGGRFDYKSCETDVLGFVIEGVAGRNAADVISTRLWQPMGAEAAADVGVDSAGEPMLDGGVSATLRDLARFGTLYLQDGCALDGVRVLPEWWVADTLAGAPDSRAAFANATEVTLMDGGMYRSGFWFPRPGSDTLMALGIHGQMIYINRRTRVVAAKVSTWPTPQDGAKLLGTIAAFDAVGAALG